MMFITILLLVVLFVLLTRCYLLKRELKRAARQLSELNNEVTSKKIDISYYDKEVEQLAVEINKQIDLTQKAEAEKRSSENELKQAISYISHDIRTPATSILGYIQFLESDEITKEVKQEYTGIIKANAQRLKTLLEEFFELSVIDQIDYPLKLEEINLNSLTLEVLLGFYEEFHQKNLEPAIHIPDHGFLLTTDPSAVKRVLENLIVNAIRHSTGHVSVELKQVDQSVQLIVRNTVKDLKEQDVQHLFDRFYKADHTRAEKGTGLGLPIAKSLMEKMNGSLSAELKENQLLMTCEWKYE
ncbi:sensor histidine kinase KdpD [Halobacillus sp. A5]|uniref:sensor histidine kinase n=1 Tax=Halobacillus sp. A5 TaxID=2880263 RepID=UPI0020A65F70|nr:HAMP domain-containing sensor histidine kinase [Halobacillus sp. A5]MCP3029493.1 HAMP domain-containing histidine kinase [Halobacillus sp. A5]